jgi:hypothetical protein
MINKVRTHITIAIERTSFIGNSLRFVMAGCSGSYLSCLGYFALKLIVK